MKLVFLSLPVFFVYLISPPNPSILRFTVVKVEGGEENLIRIFCLVVSCASLFRYYFLFSREI